MECFHVSNIKHTVRSSEWHIRKLNVKKSQVDFLFFRIHTRQYTVRECVYIQNDYCLHYFDFVVRRSFMRTVALSLSRSLSPFRNSFVLYVAVIHIALIHLFTSRTVQNLYTQLCVDVTDSLLLCMAHWQLNVYNSIIYIHRNVLELNSTLSHRPIHLLVSLDFDNNSNNQIVHPFCL